MSLYQRLDGIAKRMDELETQVRAVGNQPQAQRTSVEGGSIDFNDADGNLKAIVGAQDDGGYTTNVISGPTPPTPANFTVSVDYGKLVIHWDGEFVDGAVAPTDWDHWSAYASPGQFVVPERGTDRGGNKSASGGEVTVGVLKGQWTVTLVAWSQAGKPSVMATPVTVDVPGYGDLVQETLDDAQELIDQAKAELEAGQADLADKITAADAALSSLQDSLGELDETTLPALRQDLDAAEGRLGVAEGQIVDAFGEIAGARTDLADDSTAKANAAELAAKTAAQQFDTALKGQIDSTINQAKSDLAADINAVRTSANGKNTVTWSTSSPPAVYSGVVSDTWFVMSGAGSGATVLSQWRWNGNVWVSTKLSQAVLAQIDIGTGTFGEMDGTRLKAGSIYADRIVSGLSQNMVPDPGFVNSTINTARLTSARGYGDGNFSIQNGVLTISTTGTATGHPNMSLSANDDLYAWSAYPAMKVVAKAQARMASGAGQIVMVIRYKLRDGTLGSAAMGSYVTIGSAWTEYAWNYALSQDVASFSIVLQVNRSTSNGVIEFRSPFVASAVGGTVIEDGAITTGKLAANVLEVGNLKAGVAAIAEAVVQKIAAQTASIQQADIKNLFVTGTSSLSNVVAERIAAETAKFIHLEVGNLVAGTGTMDTATINKLFTDVVVASMAQAQAFIGENAILTGAVTASKITASEELWAKIGEFVKIRTGMLEADAVDGMVITGATIQTARTGARVTQDASGLSVYDDNDDWRVRLTPYGSTFKGDLEAESLVSTGPAEFRHTENRLGQGAKLVLEAGVTDPTAPPVVQPYWPSRSFTPPAGGVLYGLAYADSKFWTFVDIPNTAEGDRVISINPTTGAVGDDIPMTDSFGAAGGVTAIGSELFLLGQKSGTPYKYFVRVYSTAGAFLREWEYTDGGWSKTNPLTYKPGIGTDGTNVVIAQCTDAGSLTWRTYNTTTGATLSTVDCKDGTKSDIGGIYIGPGDWGGGTFVTVRKTSGNVGDAIVTFSTSGVWDPAKSWKTAENGRDTGLVFADGKFRTLNGGGGRINEYTTPSTGDGESDWWAAYRWEAVENGALVARSRISPPVRFTWPRRARLKVIGSPLPVGVSGIGGAVAKKTSTPVRTDFRQTNTHYRPGEPVALWAYLNADWKTAGIPGDSNTFPTATPSSIASASSTFEVKGDGTGRWGPLTFNPNGTVTGVPKVASGVVQLNVPSDNGRVSATVTLPAGRFTTKPAIQVTARTRWPVVHAATFIDETTTSFVVWARRDTAGPLDVAWTAIGE